MYDMTKTAVILIGYQNDYFAEDGILAGALEDTDWNREMLANTVRLLDKLCETDALLLSTPIQFTSNYAELSDPTGILEVIKNVGAFKVGETGSETIPELKAYGERVTEVPGKRGLNAFSNTKLDSELADRGVTDVVLAGVVTSICIDSTGRAAHERGYRVSVLSDCTAGRTSFEHRFYCDNIFPLYAHVVASSVLLGASE